MDPLRSSQTPLLLAMGVTLYVGLLHLWYARRPFGPHLWVALWSLIALAFQAGRLVQLHTQDPLLAVVAARSYAAMAPFLIASLCGLARSLSGQPFSPPRVIAFLAANLALSCAIAFTDWFVGSQTGLERDWFGASFIAVQGRVTLSVLPVYVVLAFAWIARAIRRSPELSPAELAALLSSIGLYAAMGLSSVASSIGWLELPGVAEYGPVVLAVSLSFLLVHRQRRLEDSLHFLVEARTAELAASELRSRGFIENAPIGIFACDARGVVTMRNPRLLSMMGRPADASTPGLLHTKIFPAMRQCLESGEVMTGEHRYTSSWGRTADIRIVLAPLRDANGVVTGAIGLVEDVTAQRALEEGLRRSQKLESVAQLAAGIAHEINNPMAFVRTNLTVLREEWQALKKAVSVAAREPALAERLGECEALIDESLEGIERTISIARDMREFAHTGSDGRAEVDLNQIVEGCVRVAGAHRKGVTRIEEQYGAVPRIWASSGQLRQVFLNLLVNALHVVGASGTVRVETAVEGSHAIVRVHDDGAGILPEHRDRLFDPFFTTKPAGEGTGLGLYISHQIVRGHGGEIAVQSSPGHGATFEVRLPLVP